MRSLKVEVALFIVVYFFVKDAVAPGTATDEEEEEEEDVLGPSPDAETVVIFTNRPEEC